MFCGSEHIFLPLLAFPRDFGSLRSYSWSFAARIGAVCWHDDKRLREKGVLEKCFKFLFMMRGCRGASTFVVQNGRSWFAGFAGDCAAGPPLYRSLYHCPKL